MIHQNDPHGAVSTDGLRAGDTVRWLENSGPRYADVAYSVARMDFEEGDESGMGDIVRLIDDNGRGVIMGPSQMSFASWQMVLDAPIGRRLYLKVRTDPVGLARR